MRAPLALLLLAALASCETLPPQGRSEFFEEIRRDRGPARLARGETVSQGLFGMAFLDRAHLDARPFGTTAAPRSDPLQVPFVGGAFQHVLWGEDVDLGLEIGATVGARNDLAYVADPGGAATPVDVDLVTCDLFGGPFVSLPLSDGVRVYGAAGPSIQFVEWDQRDALGVQNETGLAAGLYARAGFEFRLSSALLLGVGIRRIDTTVPLGGGLGDLELEGNQVFVTLSMVTY